MSNCATIVNKPLRKQDTCRVEGEDKSRIRTKPLPQFMTIAKNLALNLYRNAGFNNMAQAQRKCRFGLEQILTLFRMNMLVEP